MEGDEGGVDGVLAVEVELEVSSDLSEDSVEEVSRRVTSLCMVLMIAPPISRDAPGAGLLNLRMRFEILFKRGFMKPPAIELAIGEVGGGAELAPRVVCVEERVVRVAINANSGSCAERSGIVSR